MSNSLTKEEIKELLAEVLDARRSIPADQHDLDHEWVKYKREKAIKRSKIWEKAKSTWLGWVLIAGTIGIGSWVGDHVISFFKRFGGH